LPDPIVGVDDAWAGRGIPSPPRLLAKRAWFEIKTVVAAHPSLALPVARRRHGIVVDRDSELVIEAFPRSGMTFAVVAFEMSQPRPVRVACHVHAPAQVIAAARMGVPALVLIRDPAATILSFVIRHPHVTMSQALRAYSRFHAPLLAYRDSFEIAAFEDVISDFGLVIRRVNDRFSTGFGEFVHTPQNVERCFAAISNDYRARTGSDAELERTIARPSEERRRIKESLREPYLAPTLADSRERAEALYAALIRPG
jgi:hypothetical protein